MKLREMIAYRTPQGDTTAKSAALRYLAGFMALMLLCTLLSRIASAATMPQVTVEKPSRSAVAHLVQAEGFFAAGAETLVTTTEGILVGSIDAEVGRPVLVGDALFTLHGESLAKKIAAETVALQKLRIELSVQQQTNQLTDKREQLSYERAYEDYSDAFDRSYKSLEDARIARREAQNALDKYYRENKEVIDKWLSGKLPAGLSGMEQNPVITRYYELQAELDAADVVYDAARDNRSDNWKSARRGMEDAQLALDYNLERQSELMGLTLAVQEETLKELRRLEEDGGVIRSPIDGVVSRIAVETGTATTGNAAAMVAETDGGYRFVAEFAKDDLEYLVQGEPAQLSLETGQPLKVTLHGINNQTVTVRTPAGKGTLGGRGLLEVTKKSEVYQTCLPMSALRSDGTQYYVMVLREVETVLGTQLVAERVDVQLLDNNETRAAVSGALLDSDRVVVSSTKTVRSGDRVRLAEQ